MESFEVSAEVAAEVRRLAAERGMTQGEVILAGMEMWIGAEVAAAIDRGEAPREEVVQLLQEIGELRAKGAP
jgi:hypothetical protein